MAGQWFMTVVVFAFAFSSVLGNYAYADANWGAAARHSWCSG